MTLRGILVSLLCLSAWAQKPVKIEIRVAADRAVRTMRGGIGASWHAIENPILGHAKPPVGSHPLGGSAWGANPPAEDTAAWNVLDRHSSWLGLDWCRVELEQRMYEPRRREFDWDNPEMRILYRILDWAERNGVEVFLQQMWANVEWNAHPGLRTGPQRWLISAPASLEDFADGLATLVEHLVRTKGYRSIRWLSITNEPGFNWSWWQAGDGSPLSITPGLKALRQELDRRGIDLPLAAPDWTGLPELDPAKLDFDPLIGAYDLHSYGDSFDGFGCGVPLSATEKRLEQWARWTHGRNKPFFLSELGTSIYGNRGRDPGPGLYESALKDAALVVRGIRAGVDAFNRWSFLNRGDLDGQWQMVDTWDYDENRLRPRFTPHPNVYYLYGLLSRFTARHSTVLATEVAGNPEENARHLVAAALRSRRGNLSLLVVNETYWETDLSVSLSGLARPATLVRYAVTPADRDKAEVAVRPSGRFEVGPESAAFRDRLPGLSVAVYTTWQLAHEAAGIFTDE